MPACGATPADCQSLTRGRCEGRAAAPSMTTDEQISALADAARSRLLTDDELNTLAQVLMPATKACFERYVTARESFRRIERELVLEGKRALALLKREESDPAR